VASLPKLEAASFMPGSGTSELLPQFRDPKPSEAYMKTILCIFALLVLTASTADAYVRRAVGGGYVARGGYYGHPVARGAAVAAGTAAVAATGWGLSQPYYSGGGWGWGQPYYGGGYGYGGFGTGGYYGASAYPGYYGGYANRSYVTGRPTLFPRYYGGLGTAYPGGYPGYGGYAHRSYVTGRPTLFPRYYGW
jgi:hypothetical protein